MKKNKKTDILCLNAEFVSSLDEASSLAFSYLEDMALRMRQRGITPQLKLLLPRYFGLLTHNGNKDHAFAFEYENHTQGEYVKHKLYIFLDKGQKPMSAGIAEHLFAPLAPGQTFKDHDAEFSWCRDGRIIKIKK